MTDQQAIEKAREVAKDNDWPFEGKISVKRGRRPVFIGKKVIRIMTNANYLGGNIFITLCAKTGEVLHKGFGHR